ncbi:MAG: hypothetical protein DRM99_02400 [Thermoplasmata archaeon]|nr:MAG: hypothetical protein DRM99_02400 [Thermoplasmata archaeon]
MVVRVKYKKGFFRSKYIVETDGDQMTSESDHIYFHKNRDKVIRDLERHGADILEVGNWVEYEKGWGKYKKSK